MPRPVTRAARWIPCGVLALLALVGPAVPPAAAQTLFSPTQDPVAGSRVFGAKGCAKCHVPQGVASRIGPDLSRIDRPRTFYDLAAALWNHAPRMAHRMRQLGIARPELDPRETGDLVAFLFTLDYFDPPGNVEQGRRLFAQKRCVVCHQVGGTGGVIGPNLDALKQYESPIYLAAAMWNHGPQMSEAMRARGIPRPTFKDAELIDLIAYVNAASKGPHGGPLIVLPGRVDEGRRLFAEKRCVGCHGAGREGGGTTGPNLAERAANRSLTQFAAAMWNKAPAMTAAMKTAAVPLPQLRPEEMADIVAYLYSVRYFALGGDPTAGAKVAATKGCLGCHALHGERGKTASDLATAKRVDSPAAVISALWNHAFIADAPAGGDRARWAELRGEEIADLVAYLGSLRRAR